MTAIIPVVSAIADVTEAKVGFCSPQTKREFQSPSIWQLLQARSIIGGVDLDPPGSGADAEVGGVGEAYCLAIGKNRDRRLRGAKEIVRKIEPEEGRVTVHVLFSGGAGPL